MMKNEHDFTEEEEVSTKTMLHPFLYFAKKTTRASAARFQRTNE